jgi:hypothetical protein
MGNKSRKQEKRKTDIPFLPVYLICVTFHVSELLSIQYHFSEQGCRGSVERQGGQIKDEMIEVRIEISRELAEILEQHEV